MSLPIYQRVAVTDAGDVIPGAEYTVINENTGVAQPIYSDRSGSSLKSAPYFADSVGTIQFFIAQGTTFRVAASGGVGTYTDRYVYGVAAAVLALADGSATINRVGSDGSALTIQKDGATVGSIGTRYDTVYMAGTVGGVLAGNAGLLPGDSSGTLTNGVYDLGGSPYRFKDLHLSGGVVFGDAGGSGTSSSNTMNSYEEGTWVPSLSDGINTATSSVANGTYTKVGRMVHVKAALSITSLGSVSGSLLFINGFPFSSSNVAGTASTCNFGYGAGLNLPAGTSLSGYIGTGSARMVVQSWDSSLGTSNTTSAEWSSSGSVYLDATFYV